MKKLTLEQHRARINNINTAEADNHRYYRRHRVHDYLPGQVTYHLGDPLTSFSMAPTDYDIAQLTELAESGTGLVQVHEEWNDPLRILGADKYSSPDPEGMKKFIDLCHSLGLKIIPYVSTGYFHEYDPDFRQEFVRANCYCMNGMAWKYIQCWAGSEYWRDYILPRTFHAMDEYGFDGIYNDAGYDGWSLAWRKAVAEGKEKPEFPYDPELEDLLSTIYGEIKARGGIYKVHANKNDCPPCKDRIYDYLWIGEGTDDLAPGIGKEYLDYVIPCPDFFKDIGGSAELHFARFIPFMQFPLLTRGRPVLGKSVDVDLPFYGERTPRSVYAFYSRVKDYMKDHPNGPYVYSEWSSIPDDPQYYVLWRKYLALYKPMVEENSLVYIELRDCAEILSPLPENISASMFVNEEKYLVVSNLTGESYTLELRDNWINRESKEQAKTFIVPTGSLIFLKKVL